MNTEQELRPCPFCGTSNKLKVTPYRADDDGGEPFDWGFTVICSALGFSHAPNRGCGASGAWGETEAEAIAAWNRRAPAVAAGGVTEARVEAAAKAIFDTWSAQASYWPPMTWEEAQRAAAHPADFPKMARIVPLCRAEARAALLAALAEREGWQPIETAPPAMHVTACRFDHDAGEWVYAVVMSPPIYPFTHWRMLDHPPSRGEGE